MNTMEMDTEKLIELVRQHPVLYDLSHMQYMDSNYKFRIWADIGNKLREDGSACRARWNNLRDNYRKSLKKQEVRSGSAKTIKSYKYSNQMCFLKRFFGERSSTGNVGTQEFDNGNSSDELLADARESCPEQPTLTMQQSTDEEDYEPPEKRKVTYSRGRKETVSTQVLNYFINKNENPHPVDAFLNGISATIKSLSPRNQNCLKTEIFNIVQRYELESLTQGRNSDNTLRRNTSTVSYNANTETERESNSPTSHAHFTLHDTFKAE
ncbi:uncharacterized protein LOC143376098 isoform X2 [Andrena cerasifolii]|uniref:uncharacterized protein LOC143376098 isoform X2 n=1 Tax=Andrena cerasifolii TaxID=2819439 RepID=UPI0040376B5C